MKLPSKKEKDNLLKGIALPAAKTAPALNVRGNGDFNIGEWAKKIKTAFINANPVQSLQYIRVTPEGFEALKELCSKDMYTAPWINTFYGIPLVIKGSREDENYKARGWKPFDLPD